MALQSVEEGSTRPRGKFSQYTPVLTTQKTKVFVGIDWQSEEDGSTFPGKFCNQCHVKLGRAKKASKDGLPFQPIVPHEWSPHEDHCSVIIIIIIITIIIIMQLCSRKKRP